MAGMRILLAALALALAAPATAQQGNPFAAAVIVNERAITNFEIEQRIAILRLFRTPGDLGEAAREALIDERLQLAAADRLGIRPSEEEVQAGMEEFAGRFDLEMEQFLAAIAAGGVAEQTFRDFVRAGVAWRQVVRTRFGPRAQVTEAEVDRALALTSRRGGAEVLISEIILPARNAAEAAQAEELALQLSQISGEAAFAAAARRYSASASRGNGGRVPQPVPLANLPPPLRAQIVTLAPGEVSDPVPVQGAIAVFLLRELRETGLPEPERVSVEYARYALPPNDPAAAAARVTARVDTCDDLYGVAFGQPEEVLQVQTLAVQDLPPDIALELARLDEGETSAAFAAGPAPFLLMLCGRTEVLEEEVDRGAVRRRLIDQRLAAYADGFLAELKADAIIREP